MATIEVTGSDMTIQEAINNASPGDKIQVQSGIYRENLFINVDNITIFGDGEVILDGTDQGLVGITIDANEVILANLTFQNFTIGILSIGDKNVFHHVKSDSNVGSGFKISGHLNTVRQCQINNNQDKGIILSGRENLFYENSLEGNRRGGFLAGPGDFRENIIANNYFDGNGNFAININTTYSDKNIVYTNLIQNSSNGIIVKRGRFFIGLNTITNINQIGIMIEGNYSIIFKNTLINSKNGIMLKANDSSIIENVVEHINNTAILIQGNRNYARQNTVSQFHDVGILVNGFSNTLRCNTPLTSVVNYSATGENNVANDTTCDTLANGIQEINLDNLTDGYKGLLELFYKNF